MKKRRKFEDFFAGTVADWERCEIPDRPPDYVSYSGSAYWDCKHKVKRLSNHWGKVASCRWYLEGQVVQRTTLCAECAYDEFRSTRALDEAKKEG